MGGALGWNEPFTLQHSRRISQFTLTVLWETSLDERSIPLYSIRASLRSSPCLPNALARTSYPIPLRGGLWHCIHAYGRVGDSGDALLAGTWFVRQVFPMNNTSFLASTIIVPSRIIRWAEWRSECLRSIHLFVRHRLGSGDNQGPSTMRGFVLTTKQVPSPATSPIGSSTSFLASKSHASRSESLVLLSCQCNRVEGVSQAPPVGVGPQRNYLVPQWNLMTNRSF